MQRPPPVGSASHTEPTGPGIPPLSRQAAADGAEPHAGGSCVMSWQQILPGGSVVLVVEVVDVVVEIVVVGPSQQPPVLL